MDEELQEKKLRRQEWNKHIRIINARTIGGEPSEHSEPAGKPINDNPWKCYNLFNVNIEKIEELQKILEREEMTIKSAITCRQCKQNRIKTQTVQDRSLDEGMSTIASCVSCGYKWKESS